jgi:SAM-dependent methyltransferase
VSATVMAPMALLPGGSADSRDVRERFLLRCPACLAALSGASVYGTAVGNYSVVCEGCSFRMEMERGIWNAIRPERKERFERFVREYETVRAGEGRGSSDHIFYLELPFGDATGRNAGQWKIRARSFQFLKRNILRPLAHKTNAGLTVLDLGAGNGWMSYRLARLGHRPVAVDLLTNASDGLAAAGHYLAVLPKLFPRFQAEMDRLPFQDAQFDCAVFNASFHYSEDYANTFGEALRCVKPGGIVAIVDSPWYREARSGEQMVEERKRDFQKRFGFASDALASRNFLTDGDLHELQSRFGIQINVHRPWYGVRWASRPLVAQIKRKREPSKFRIYVAEVPLA